MRDKYPNNIKNTIMNLGKILLGTLAGFAIGATLGVIFAPDKGSETRKKISKKGEDYAEGLKDKFNEFVDKVSEKVDEINDAAQEEIEDVTGKVKDKFKAKA